MPIYVLECKKGHRFDKVLPLKDYNVPQICDCGEIAYRKTVPTMISPDIQPWDHYVSPSTGQYITSYKQRREDMKRSNCVDYDPSIRTESDRRIAEQDRKLDKAIEQTVEREYEKMSSDKKASLEKELSLGADLQYTRGKVNG